MRIPIRHDGSSACFADDEGNYKTDDDAEMITSW